MGSDAQRAAIDACTEQIPCPTRRRLIGGLATLAATAGLPQVVVPRDQYHAAVRYLHGEFMKAASSLGQADANSYHTLYRRMLALATALSVIPAGAQRSLRLKREVAAWSLQDGRYTVILPDDLAEALISGDRA